MSLAAIKRAIQPGTRVTLTHHGDHGPGDTFPWANRSRTLPVTRPVAVVQTNAIAFEDPHMVPKQPHHAWLYWPKASDVTVHDACTFTVHAGGKAGDMTYVIER